MKKQIISLIGAIPCCTACTKQNSIPTESVAKSETMSSAGAAPVTYATCDRVVNIFTPSLSTAYTLAMADGIFYRKFGIPSLGKIDFQNIDKVSFEFSGSYADAAHMVKLYRIKRTDGKYLTFQTYAGYCDKFEGDSASMQLWIMNDLGGNKYNFILPKMYSCWLLRTYYDTSSRSYRIGFVISNQTSYSGSIVLYCLPSN